MITIGINLISCKSEKLVGTWKYVKRHFDEMKYIDLDNYKFIFYIPKNINPSIFSIPSNCKHDIVQVIPIKSYFLRFFYVQTFFYLKMKKCDVIYSPDSLLPWFCKAKKIISILDMYWFTHKQVYSWLKRYLGLIITEISILNADKIITISESSKRDIISKFKHAEKKLQFNYCFISNDEISHSLSKINNEKFNNFDFPFFLSVSTLQPIKNYEGLISAFAILHRIHPRYKLYIAGGCGDINYATKLHKLVKQYRLEQNVIFTGYINDAEIYSLYKGCFGVIMPSFYEGFGYAPLEGFYWNKPCVVSKVSSLPEVAGNAGVYVDPYDVHSICDGMKELIMNYDHYKEHIPEQIEKFNAKKLTQNFIKILTYEL